MTDFVRVQNNDFGDGNQNVGFVLAPHSEAVSWRKYYWELYETGRGAFHFDIEVGDLMMYNMAETNYFTFVTHGSVVHNHGNLECRYGKYITPALEKVEHMYPSV